MQLRYRPEIDGLRAIAVLAVVFYHAQFALKGVSPFKGGYLGVDVFFVISGYLITSLILRGIIEGTFSFRNFYERRARRLLPALFIVMLTTAPFAWSLMLPKALKEYAGSGIAALLFGSNFWFWKEDSYNAEPSLLKPLLHTWSLSVEEQFYLLFPISLLLIWRFARKFTLPIFLLGSVVSLLIANSGSLNFSDATFYLLPTRAWELLLGAFIAKYQINNGLISNNFFRKCLPGLGLALIGISIFIFDDETRHPSYITLLPVAGVVLFIWFSAKGDIFTNLLSTRPVVAIGLVSYSFYLWHYPIFAFVRIKYMDPSQYHFLLAVILAFLFSVVTYFLIERPFRNPITVPRNYLYLFLAAAFVALLCTNIYFYRAVHNPENPAPIDTVLSEFDFSSFTRGDFHNICSTKADDQNDLFDKRWCEIGVPGKTPDFIVVGDSHAQSSLHFFDQMARKTNQTGLFMFRGGCPPIYGVYPMLGDIDSSTKCRTINNEAYELGVLHGISNIFFVTRWDYYVDGSDTGYMRKLNTLNATISQEDSRKVFQDQLKNTFDMYARNQIKVVVLLQPPHQKVTPLQIYNEIFANWRDLSNFSHNKIQTIISGKSLTREEHLYRQKMTNKLIVESSAGNAYVDILDPLEILCDEYCTVGDLKVSYYADDHDHLSVAGFRKLLPLYRKYFISN